MCAPRADEHRAPLVAGRAEDHAREPLVGPAQQRDDRDREDQRAVEDVVRRELLAVHEREGQRDERDLEQRGDDRRAGRGASRGPRRGPSARTAGRSAGTRRRRCPASGRPARAGPSAPGAPTSRCSATKIASQIPAKSSAASDSTRARCRSVLIFSTNASAGGRLRRTSCGLSAKSSSSGLRVPLCVLARCFSASSSACRLGRQRPIAPDVAQLLTAGRLRPAPRCRRGRSCAQPLAQARPPAPRPAASRPASCRAGGPADRRSAAPRRRSPSATRSPR